MRPNQIGITIERFGDEVPERYKGHEKISVYADANNFYEVLAAAFDEALVAIREDAKLPSFERRGRWMEARILHRK